MPPHYIDPDYGPNLGHPNDPRNDPPEEIVCDKCDGEGCSVCDWVGVLVPEAACE